jgi:hypothetical protein
MHRDLGPADAVSVGMFLQTLLLALTERALGSCVEVSIAGYPEIVRATGYPLRLMPHQPRRMTMALQAQAMSNRQNASRSSIPCIIFWPLPEGFRNSAKQIS